MKYKIEIRSIWEVGQRKDENGNPHQEDCIFPAPGKYQSDDRLFILCDGMGGHAAGEVASATVCDAMSKMLLSIKTNYTADDIANAVTAAYDALDALDNGSQGKSKMGTTMTCLVLHEGGVIMSHMGDSRIYHIRPGKEREDTNILFQTRDHSLVNDLIAIGEITPEEAKTHPRKNVITRALQPHMENRQRADIKTSVNVRAGDWFYLCSDGMLEQMDDSTIRFIFSNSTGDIDNKAEMLIQATRENKDNHTAFLIHILEVENPLPVEDENKQDTLPPLMGTIEDDVHSKSNDNFDDDKSTEIELGDDDHHQSDKRTNLTHWTRGFVLLALALVIIIAGRHFAKSYFTKPTHSEPDKTEQQATVQRSKPTKSTRKQEEANVIQNEIAKKEHQIDSLRKCNGDNIAAQIAAISKEKDSLAKVMNGLIVQIQAESEE